jgi:hypothetical protein
VLGRLGLGLERSSSSSGRSGLSVEVILQTSCNFRVASSLRLPLLVLLELQLLKKGGRISINAVAVAVAVAVAATAAAAAVAVLVVIVVVVVVVAVVFGSQINQRS